MNVNNIQCYFTQVRNEALASGVNPDSDPAFIKLVDAAWEAMQQYQADPSALNTQVVMQDVNALGTYFNGTAPDSSTQAYKVWQALQAPIDISGTTLLQGCQEYTDKTKVAAAVNFFMSTTGGALINKSGALYAALNPYGSQKSESGKPIAADIQALYADLDLFNKAQAMGDSAAAAVLAPLVAADIKKVIADSSGVTDGYLTNIVTLLNTATTVGGSSLATLAAGADPAAFLAALQSVGESGGSGDLSSMIKNSCSNEGISLPG